MINKKAILNNRRFLVAFSRKSKKCISSVVAVSLILVVTVVVIGSLSGWFDQYSSGLKSGIESSHPIGGVVEIDSIVGDNLYLNVEGTEVLKSLRIRDLQGNVKCDLFNGSISSVQGDTRLLLSFDDGTATDLSGYGNDGTSMGGSSSTFTDCRSKGCFNFDGINDWLEHGSDASLDIGGGNWTISIWYNADEYKYQNLISKVIGVDDKEFIIEYHATRQMFVSVEVGGNNYWTASDVVYDLNKWQNIIIVQDAQDLSLRHYLNGKEYTFSENGGPYVLPSNFNANLNIGRIGGTYQSAYFNGKIDEVAIYSKALTDSQVSILYQSKKALMYEQLLNDGIEEVDLSSCDLNSGVYYEIVGQTSTDLIQRKIRVE